MEDMDTGARCHDRRRNWSELPPEILDLVLQKLAFTDCLTFGVVCISWRYVFHDRCRLCLPPPYMVGMPAGAMTSPLPLWGLHEGRFLKFQSLRLGFRPSERIVGSSLGWLVVASTELFSLYLLNPISKERIMLPSMASCRIRMMAWLQEYTYALQHVELSSAPTTDNCIVVARGMDEWKTGFDWYRLSGFVWCRLGDQEWTIFRLPLEINIEDIAFHQGKLYVLGDEGDIWVYVFDPSPKMTQRASITSNPLLYRFYWRLVESGGELLSVAHYGGPDGLEKLYLSKRCEDGTWKKVESLDDRVLFIGEHSRESFLTKDFMDSNFEANCIYYTRPVVLMKYSMTEGISKRIATLPHSYLHSFPRLEWVRAQTW